MKPTRRFATLCCLILATEGIIGCNSNRKPDTPASAPPKARPAWWQDTSGMQAGAFPQQVAATLTSTAHDAVWEPKAQSDKTRGASSDVYQQVAPATVVVRCGMGHGTGFIIDKEGWIVTNHHVIAAAAPDPESGAATAIVHFGRLENDWMKLIDDSVPAVVYKASLQSDLALLKLARMPHGLEPLPVVKIAAAGLKVGDDCIAIGHPQAGMLWTFRQGKVANQGVWPQDQIDVVLTTISAPAGDRQRLKAAISRAPRRKVLLSSCGLNPGDSGGPLVNDRGELIAVSFAIPASESPEVSLDKFSYHVQLDEVKDFLKERPTAPEILVPDAWPPGRYNKPVDLAGEGKEDGVVFSVSPDGQATGLVVDLHEENGLMGALKQLVQGEAEEEPKVSFAWHRVPYPRTFYDTDGDGEIDLILTDTNHDGKAESVLRLVDGKWQAEPANGRKLVDGSYFTNKKFAKRFTALKLDQIK